MGAFCWSFSGRNLIFFEVWFYVSKRCKTAIIIDCGSYTLHFNSFLKVLLFDLFKAAIWFFILLGFPLMYICIFETVKLHLRCFWRSFFLYTSVTQSQIEMSDCLELSTIKGNVYKVWTTILVAFLLFPMTNKVQDQHGKIKNSSLKMNNFWKLVQVSETN